MALSLITPASRLPIGALDVAVDWAHSSDLPDPTPFLAKGHLLLTTGTQFSDGEIFAAEYVKRLVDIGVCALGFGTEVNRAGAPEELVTACIDNKLPLFEVPYRIPFIAIVRTIADCITEATYARQTWVLATQRAISLAALRPNGLSAVLAELSTRLDTWVGLIDVTGRLTREFPKDGVPRKMISELLVEARRMLRGGKRSSVVVNGDGYNLQTLGVGGALRGVLAIGKSVQLDASGREVVNSVIALAGLALEQNHHLDRAIGHLRSGILRSLLAGDYALASDVAKQMWGPLPPVPYRVCVTVTSNNHAGLVEFLELWVAENDGRMFFALHDDRLVLLVADHDVQAITTDLANGFSLPLGISDATSNTDITVPYDQALTALTRALEKGFGAVTFDEISRQGVLAFIARTNASEVARATLAPLTEHDTDAGTALVHTVRTWLMNNGQFDATSQALGLHRHTVRSRIAQVERLLGRDLSEFHTRADLWAALLAVENKPSAKHQSTVQRN